MVKNSGFFTGNPEFFAEEEMANPVCWGCRCNLFPIIIFKLEFKTIFSFDLWYNVKYIFRCIVFGQLR